MISHFLWETSQFTTDSYWKHNSNSVAQRCFIITLLSFLPSSAATSSPCEFTGRTNATTATEAYMS